MKQEKDKKFSLTKTGGQNPLLGSENIIETKKYVVKTYRSFKHFLKSEKEKTPQRLKYGFASYAGRLLKGTKKEKLLLEILDRGDSEFKKKAIRRLDRLNPAWRQGLYAQKYLPKYLNDLKSSTGPNAAMVLGLAGDEKAVVSLIRELENGDEKMKIVSAEALGSIGDKRAVDPLIKALNAPNEILKKNAIVSLGKIADNCAFESLLALLEDGTVRKEAVEALGLLGNKDAIDPIIEILQDPDENIRVAVAGALGQFSDKMAVLPLIDALKDDEWRVVEAAARALGQIGDERAVDPLLDFPSPVKFPSFIMDREKCLPAIVESLGLIGSAKAVPKLITLNKEHWGLTNVSNDALKNISSISKPYVKHYPNLFCEKCYYRPITGNLSRRSEGNLSHRSKIVFCPKCYSVRHLLIDIKSVVGVIGSKNVKLGRENDYKVSIWNENGKNANFVDIDILLISEGEIENYEFAINSVILELSGSKLKSRNWMKKITVRIEGNPNLSKAAQYLLKDNFNYEI